MITITFLRVSIHFNDDLLPTKQEDTEAEFIISSPYAELTGSKVFFLDVPCQTLDEGKTDWLERTVEEGISEAVSMLGNLKSPVPDGFSGEFLKKCWSTTKNDIFRVFQEFGTVNRRTNETCICLIPKKTSAPKVGELGTHKSSLHIIQDNC